MPGAERERVAPDHPAEALVPVGRAMPARSRVLGMPGRIVREVRDDEITDVIAHGHAEYLQLLEDYTSARSPM